MQIRLVNGNLSRALGIAGIGIGLAEIAAPRWISKRLGVKVRPNLLRVMGAREIASGAGILGRRNAAPGQWSRVIGDVLDVALLGVAAVESRKRTVVLGVLGAVVAIGVLDWIAARRL
jgi:hypothetical protein